ncbi:unnamed protein product [Closterium sp. Naga37s-1]|nr:unnamed protein product [Closterium sp. Naga37s-1]
MYSATPGSGLPVTGAVGGRTGTGLPVTGLPGGITGGSATGSTSSTSSSSGITGGSAAFAAPSSSLHLSPPFPRPAASATATSTTISITTGTGGGGGGATSASSVVEDQGGGTATVASGFSPHVFNIPSGGAAVGGGTSTWLQADHPHHHQVLIPSAAHKRATFVSSEGAQLAGGISGGIGSGIGGASAGLGGVNLGPPVSSPTPEVITITVPPAWDDPATASSSGIGRPGQQTLEREQPIPAQSSRPLPEGRAKEPKEKDEKAEEDWRRGRVKIPPHDYSHVSAASQGLYAFVEGLDSCPGCPANLSLLIPPSCTNCRTLPFSHSLSSCAAHRIAYAALRRPDHDFTVAATVPSAAQATAGMFHESRAPLVLQATRKRGELGCGGGAWWGGWTGGSIWGEGGGGSGIWGGIDRGKGRKKWGRRSGWWSGVLEGGKWGSGGMESLWWWKWVFGGPGRRELCAQLEVCGVSEAVVGWDRCDAGRVRSEIYQKIVELLALAHAPSLFFVLHDSPEARLLTALHCCQALLAPPAAVEPAIVEFLTLAHAPSHFFALHDSPEAHLLTALAAAARGPLGLPLAAVEPAVCPSPV